MNPAGEHYRRNPRLIPVSWLLYSKSVSSLVRAPSSLGIEPATASKKNGHRTRKSFDVLKHVSRLLCASRTRTAYYALAGHVHMLLWQPNTPIFYHHLPGC